MLTSKPMGALAAACFLSLIAAPVLAQTIQKTPPPNSPAATLAAASGPAAGQATPQSLSTEELAQLSGGDGGVALAVSTQNASNTGNQINANSVLTGGINVSQDAFSNFNGLGNIIMNTGNNNNIQSSMSVSISMPAK